MNAFARLLLCTALSGLALGAQARTFEVSDFAELDNAVIEAEDGDEIVIKKGVYELEAPLEIFSRVTVRGEQGAVIDAGGRGSGFIVRVPKVRIENLTVRNYGGDLYAREAGVMVGDGADGTELVNLTLQGPGFGVRADRMNALVVEGCTIEGDAARHVLDRGDGIFLSYVKNARLNHNSLRNVRDGYYLENVDAAKSDFNYFTGAQYGIHYMYTRDCTATGNRAVGVRGGYALMSSDRVTLTKSYSSRNIEFGILLNVADGCLVEENTVEGVHNSKGRAALDNEGKGIFIYGPGKSRVTRNWIAESDIGIGVALGGEGNVLWDNAFVDNQIQVRYVGETPLEWSFEGRGNYWSTNLGWDVDHDGISDRAYQPNDSLDRIFWIYPEARFLMDSPVTALLRWLASQFEIDRGKGVTDSHPLVRPWLSRLLPDVYRYVPVFRKMRREYAGGNDRILRGATAVLLIHAPKESRFGTEDANLAYQNASLMAEVLGVSQIYMGFVLTAVRQDRKKGLCRMLGLGGRRICAVMALGMPQFRYPNYIDRTPSPLERR